MSYQDTVVGDQVRRREDRSSDYERSLSRSRGRSQPRQNMYRGRREGGGARYLASIQRSESDRKNCPFYFKMGACRHGESCSRQHHCPAFSRTVLLRHMWLDTPGKTIEDFEDFFMEVYEECTKSGNLQSVCVLENEVEHLRGHVYVTYADEEDAIKLKEAMHGRYYDGSVIVAEFSPVLGISRHWCEGRCKQFDKNGLCRRGHQCNYLHVRPLSENLRKDLRPWRQQDSKRRKKDASPNKDPPLSQDSISAKSQPQIPTEKATPGSSEVDHFLDSLQQA